MNADVVVVNSCTVTDEADHQSQKWVRDIARKNPKAKIIYTGCAAEVNSEGALKIPGVGAVLGNQDKPKAAALIREYLDSKTEHPVALGGVSPYTEILSRHPHDREWSLPSERLEPVQAQESDRVTFRTRAFLKIQEGCNSFCTYCIIPYGRGPARSLSVEAILSKIQQSVDIGIQEVILTGTNLGDYGMDWTGSAEDAGRRDSVGLPQLDFLVEQILTQTGLKRLRIGSLDPTEISPKLMELMENYEAFCPHFHMSLQHVQTKILRLMKRKYQAHHVETCLNQLAKLKRKPFVGMDYITGFPGETDEDFLNSVKTLEQLPWNRLHVFPYSEREGTPATRLANSVPLAVRKERAKQLQQLSLERLGQSFSSQRSAGNTVLKGVLLEGRYKGPDGTRDWVSGYSANYQRVIIPLKTPEHLRTWNQLVQVEVKQWIVDKAAGEVIWLGTLQ